MTDFSKTRAAFHLPDDVIYLDGNSLGPLPVGATERMTRTMQDEWGQMLITGWNDAGWMDQPQHLGNRIARLVGAETNSVVVGETLSIRIYQALDAALKMRPDRRVILSDTGNFPSDLYIAQGLIRQLGGDLELRLVAPEDVMDAIDDTVAVTLLSHVDYRTARLHDMRSLTAKAHEVGALTVWDLAHSAGALQIALSDCNADFAAGCTYKFLNAGPGAPAFVYAAPRLADQISPALSGWLGHAAPFRFEADYQPAPGINRMRIGTPPVLAMAALEAALDVYDMVQMSDLRTASITLSQRLIAGIAKHCPELSLASPVDPAQRGSHVSFAFNHGYAVIQALISRGVIGDFRAPNIMRFGITPLYLSLADIDRAVAEIADILDNRIWDNPAYLKQKAVT